jgi:ubiquinone/menaquinone biosynthesis C-methylase UbiE
MLCSHTCRALKSSVQNVVCNKGFSSLSHSTVSVRTKFYRLQTGSPSSHCVTQQQQRQRQQLQLHQKHGHDIRSDCTNQTHDLQSQPQTVNTSKLSSWRSCCTMTSVRHMTSATPAASAQSSIVASASCAASIFSTTPSASAASAAASAASAASAAAIRNRDVKARPSTEFIQTLVRNNYSAGHLVETITAALEEANIDLSRVTTDDLRGIDEFHTLGHIATAEIATRLGLKRGDYVLDVGCGLGGAARHFVTRHPVEAVGVDVSEEFVQTARHLTLLTRLPQTRVRFRLADANQPMPFNDGTFTAACMLHVGMNIPNKLETYKDIRRMLNPGSKFVIFDMLYGDHGRMESPPHFPVPWSLVPETSFLATEAEMKHHLEEAGFCISVTEDKSHEAIKYFSTVEMKAIAQELPPMSLKLLMRDKFRPMISNVVRNLREKRIQPTMIEAVAV